MPVHLLCRLVSTVCSLTFHSLEQSVAKLFLGVMNKVTLLQHHKAPKPTLDMDFIGLMFGKPDAQ